MKLFSSIDILVLVFYAFDILFLYLFHAKIGKFFADGLSLKFLSCKLSRDFKDFSFTIEELKLERSLWQNVPFFGSNLLKAINTLLISINNSIFIFILDFFFRKIENIVLVLHIIIHAKNRKSIHIDLILLNFPEIRLFL